MRIAAGTTIGRYAIERLLGIGGMGEVYLARDEQLGRNVALKLLTEELRRDEAFQQRLRSEARAASALNHPHILTVHEIGEADGEHFIAMEFVDGVTLRERVGKLPLLDIVRIVEKIAEALTAAETAGILHRDIKPDNIMIRTDGYVKVLDFGLARRGDAADESHTRTVRGTVHYMSPEQLRGLELDARSDVWSLGVLLSELVSGQRPFEGATATEVVTAIVTGSAAPLAGPEQLQSIVRRSLQKDRRDRYPTMNEMRADLQLLRREIESGSFEWTSSFDKLELTSEFLPTPIPTPTIRRPSNLPILLTPLVGREEEVIDVRQMLSRDEVRLVTLTGAGGTGKTRLALQIALELVAFYSGGAFFVPLASISDPALIPEAIAAALGKREDAGRSFLDTVKREIAADEMLLVVDNLEQLLSGTAVFAELLEALPGLKILATSQAPLRLRGEHEYAVPPLAVPSAEDSAASLLHNPAVSLFLERAQAMDPRFALTEENAGDIAAICKRLDGLPLAIELAAARIRLMSPKQMLARLDSRLSLLTGGSRDLPSRQQTMHAAISWGFNLLAEREQLLLARLSVFEGGISLEAAEAIGGAGSQIDVASALETLVERSFARREEGDGEARFAMLGTIRDYGAERLASGIEVTAIKTAHATFFLRLAEDAEERLHGEQQREAIALLEREHENLQAAMQWVTLSGQSERALRFAGALWWFWYMHGHYSLGRRWIEAALKHAPPDGSRHVSSRALVGAGVLAFLQCEYEIASTRLERAARIAEEVEDGQTYAMALQFLGSIARERGSYERALELHRLSLDYFKELGDRAGIARSLNYIGFASWLSGDTETTATVCQEALSMFTSLADTEGVAWSKINLAAAAEYGGDHELAMQMAKEALALARETGFKEGVAWSLNLLGIASRRRGQTERAAGFLRKSFAMHWELGDRWRTASVLEALMGLRVDAGDAHGAALLFGATFALRESIGTPVPPVERADFDRDVRGVTEMDAVDRGRSMSVHEVLAAVFPTS